MEGGGGRAGQTILAVSISTEKFPPIFCITSVSPSHLPTSNCFINDWPHKCFRKLIFICISSPAASVGRLIKLNIFMSRELETAEQILTLPSIKSWKQIKEGKETAIQDFFVRLIPTIVWKVKYSRTLST